MRTVALVLAAALLAAACTGTDPTPDRTPFVRPTREVRPTVPGPPTDVRLEVGDDFQAVVDATPPGSTYLIAAGMHRMQQVVPHYGDTFRGEPGAVLNGARLLDAGDFVAEAGAWFLDGITEDGLERGQPGPGASEAIRQAEEVFVDDRPLTPVADRDAVGPGTYLIDQDAQRLWLGDDPSGFETIELSVTPYAFGGTGVRGVTIEDLVVEKYASPAQFGAIGGSPPEEFPYDWTIRYVEARLNHGGGIGISPGVTIRNADVHDNGQIGLVGWGEDTSTDPPGYSALVTIADTRIHANNRLGFNWVHEAGGTKIKRTREGSLVTGVWLHDNDGPGLWFDIDNIAATIRGNLVEDNTGSGIFYEISTGPTLIERNIVRRNGHDPDRFAAGVFVSNASDVTVRDNLVFDNLNGIAGVSRGDRDPQTTNLVVIGNDVTVGSGWTGLQLDRGAPADLLEPAGGSRFEANRYVGGEDREDPFRWGERLSWVEWQGLGLDVDGTFGAAPAPEPTFTPATYGPRWAR